MVSVLRGRRVFGAWQDKKKDSGSSRMHRVPFYWRHSIFNQPMKLNVKTSLWNRLRLPCAAVATMASLSAANADTYSDIVKADGPTAYYRMEDAAGSDTITDEMGAYSGTWTYAYDDSGNPTYPKLAQPGIDVNAVALHPGSSANYGTIPWAEALSPSSAYTVEVWVRPASGSSTYHTPLASVGSDISTGWLIGQTDKQWIWCLKYGNIWMQGGAVSMLHWHHLVATFDGTTVHFYVNGVEATDPATVPDYTGNNGGDTIIGGINTGGLNFDGSVDEIAFYDKALSLDRIQAHYQTGTNSIRAVDTPPSVLNNPEDVSVYEGHKATFSVTADGTAPLSYQWYKGSNAITDATDSSLSFVCALADNNATYKVVVTNSLGTVTSTAATLTVLTDLYVSGNPVSVSRYAGAKAGFFVEADGALPITYQWYKGTSIIPNGTNAMLWLNNLTAADDGTAYYALVKNAYMSTNSDVATLTVTTRSTTVPVTGNAKIVMADSPIAYWRLDEAEGSEAVIDAAGNFDGTYDNADGTGTFTYQAITGVPNDTDGALGVTKGARVLIPWAPELNPHGVFSVEAWVKPATQSTGSGDDYRTAFSSESDAALADNPTGWLMYHTPDDTWTWVVYKGYWQASWLNAADVHIVAGEWYHMVLTYDGSLFNFYINGALQTSQAVEGYIPNRNGPFDIGWRTINGTFPAFDGTIDEVAVYNQALTLSQVQTHYQHTVAPSSIAIARSGSDAVLTWTAGTLQESTTVNGTFTDVAGAVSPYTTTPGTNTAKFYRLKGQ
jgi:hypothetical protein